MKKIDFNAFCILQEKEINDELTILKSKLSKLTSKNKINLDEYGSRKELVTRYKKANKTSIVKKILGPTESDLQEFIFELEKNRLQKRQTSLNKLLSLLNELKKSVVENTFVKDISSNYSVFNHQTIIKLIIEYSEKYNIPAEEILDILISLFKVSEKAESVESQLENNLGNFFDSQNYPLKGLSNEDITFALSKLLNLTLGEDYIDKYPITITSLLNEINLRSQKINSSEGAKALLDERKKALQELQHYIEGPEVIKVHPDLDTFRKNLKKAGFSPLTIKDYLDKMSKKIIQNEKEKRIKHDKMLLQKYLTDSGMEICKRAKELKNNIKNQEMKAMLERTLKDVVSLCRYAELSGEFELAEIMERISNKVGFLQSELQKINNPLLKKPTYNYFISSEGLPLILRNLEIIDPMDYIEVYNLLNQLQIDNINSKPLIKKDGITIYQIKGKELILRYAKRGSETIIISAYHRSVSQENILTEKEFNMLKEQMDANPTKETVMFQKMCEDLILQSLNLYEPEKPYRLTK